MLTQVNECLKDVEPLYGFNIVCRTTAKSFVNKSHPGQAIEYQFLIPRESLIQYKSLDISGQQLINESVIIMDGDRIELILQETH
jgi:hypothetical protein